MKLPKDYDFADAVLQRFRAAHPRGSILTEVLELGGRLVVRAVVRVEGDLIASAHKEPVTKTAFAIEKAESGAMRRALLIAGFGRQDDPEEVEDVTTADEYRDALEHASTLDALQRIAQAIATRHPALAAGELNNLRTVFEARRAEILDQNQETAA